MVNWRNTLSQKTLHVVLSVLMVYLALPLAAQQKDTEAALRSPTEQQSVVPKPQGIIDSDKKHIELLSDEIESGEVHWLDAQGGKYMALWQADTTGNPFGALLILHGEGQSADWPYTINAIRVNLSQHGWATLAIGLPSSQPSHAPPRPKQGNNETNESSNKQAVDLDNQPAKIEPEEIAQARLHSAIKFLNAKGQYNIILVGHGTGALRAAKFIDQLTSQSPAATPSQAGQTQIPYSVRALVMVSARNHQKESEDRLTSYFNNVELPILDIYYGEHFLDGVETTRRLKKARSTKLRYYYQIKMLRPSSSGLEAGNRLTKRIRGFLNKHAKGVEIERPRGF